jgi:hypothetical protein
MRGSLSYWRWLVIAFATIMWGFPLSVLSDCLGHGDIAGWLAGFIVVLLGDLFIFIWWNGLEQREQASLARQSADHPRAAWQRHGVRSYRDRD